MKLGGVQFAPKLEIYKASYITFSISHFVIRTLRLHSNAHESPISKQSQEYPLFIPNMATIKNVAITGVSTTTQSYIKMRTNTYLRLPAIWEQQY